MSICLYAYVSVCLYVYNMFIHPSILPSIQQIPLSKWRNYANDTNSGLLRDLRQSETLPLARLKVQNWKQNRSARCGKMHVPLETLRQRSRRSFKLPEKKTMRSQSKIARTEFRRSSKWREVRERVCPRMDVPIGESLYKLGHGRP